MVIKIKRAYDPVEQDDGFRVLVDRLWPRGVSKEQLKLKAWLRELAPSNELREWFGHDVSRWDDFKRRYVAELDATPDAVKALADLASRGDVTLVYAARDSEHNNAAVLKEYLRTRPRFQVSP